MGLEKFNAVHSFLSNTEDGDIIRGSAEADNSVFGTAKSSATGSCLYKRTGFFGRLWQEIFASSDGATRRREEAATLIRTAIGEIQNIKDNRNNPAISSIVTKIENLIKETSQDFDTKSIKDEFENLARHKESVTYDELVDLRPSTPVSLVQKLEVEEDQHIAGSATTTTPEITSLPHSNFPDKGSHPDLELTNLVTANEISALPAPMSHAPVLETISNKKEKNAFGLVLIKNSLEIYLSNQTQPLSVMHADAYILPSSPGGIGLLDKINGKGSPSIINEKKEVSSSSFFIKRGTQRLQNLGSSDPVTRDFYSATATVPEFTFLVKKNLSTEKLSSYNDLCITYQKKLSKIYDEAFEALFTSGTAAGTPIQTIALLPLSQIANQVRDVEIEAMVFSVSSFQKRHPGVKVAILTNSETKRSQIDTAFKTHSQEDNPQLTAADQALQ